MPFQDHVALLAGLVDPHRRTARFIRLVERTQRPEGGGSGEHLGIGGRDEALIGVDRDDFGAGLIHHDQAKARAGAGAAQHVFDPALQRGLGVERGRQGGDKQQDEGRDKGAVHSRSLGPIARQTMQCGTYRALPPV
ncbi:hypothetical protein D9M73_114210 [compost metagenome]